MDTDKLTQDEKQLEQISNPMVEISSTDKTLTITLPEDITSKLKDLAMFNETTHEQLVHTLIENEWRWWDKHTYSGPKFWKYVRQDKAHRGTDRTVVYG